MLLSYALVWCEETTWKTVVTHQGVNSLDSWCQLFDLWSDFEVENKCSIASIINSSKWPNIMVKTCCKACSSLQICPYVFRCWKWCGQLVLVLISFFPKRITSQAGLKNVSILYEQKHSFHRLSCIKTTLHPEKLASKKLGYLACDR